MCGSLFSVEVQTSSLEVLKNNSLKSDNFFSGSRFFWVKVFQVPGFSGFRFFRIQVFRSSGFSGSESRIRV